MEAKDLAKRLQAYTGRKFNEREAKIMLLLEDGDRSLKDVSACLDESLRCTWNSCRFLNEINMCWWNEESPPKFYLTAEGKSALNTAREEGKVPNA